MKPLQDDITKSFKEMKTFRYGTRSAVGRAAVFRYRLILIGFGLPDVNRFEMVINDCFQ